MRIAIIAAVLALLLAACSDGALTLPEYLEELEALTAELGVAFDTLDDEFTALSAPTIEETQAYLDSRVAGRAAFVEAAAALEPPDFMRELHNLALDGMRQFLEAEEELAALGAEAETAADIDAMWQSDVANTWRALDAASIELCRAAEAEFAAPDDPVEFGDLPWLPSETAQIVQAAFGCTRAERGGG